jgi:integrase/ribosomal protein L40E
MVVEKMKDFELQIKNMLAHEDLKDSKKILEDYNEHLEDNDKKANTRKTRILALYNLLRFCKKPIQDITKEDINRFVRDRRKKVSEFTLNTDKASLKVFFRWFKKEDVVSDLKVRRIKNHLPVDNLLKPKDIRAMINVTEKTRDRALLMLFWDSAARLDEVMQLKIKNVQFDKYGAVVIVNGKTGMRRLRLVDSVPDLQAWLNQHPLKDDPDAPLFISMWKNFGSPLAVESAYYIIKQAAKKAKIKKDVSPHKFRHARLTDLAKKGFQDSELRIIAGWEADSKMPATYIHMAGADVEKKILAMHGVEEPEEEERVEERPTAPITCPRCLTRNPPDFKFCGRCSMVLDPKTAMELEGAKKTAGKVIDVGVRKKLIQLRLLLNDPEVIRVLDEEIDVGGLEV